MPQYPAFVDGEAGAYGVTFPDLPGIVAMGETMGDALANAQEALRDYETERDGAQVAEASPLEGMPPARRVIVPMPPTPSRINRPCASCSGNTSTSFRRH